MTGIQAKHEVLTRCVTQGLSFVAFRYPGASLHLWLQQGAPPAPGSGALEERCFLLAPFAPGSPAHAIRPDREWDLERELPELKALATSTAEHNAFSLPATTGRAAFEKTVELALEEMAQGHLEKVVLSRAVHAECPITQLATHFLEALEAYPEAFVVLAHTPATGTWLGASPERLVRMAGDKLFTEAIAGTMDVAAAEAAGAWGAKERHEQELVALAVEEALHASGARSIERGRTEVIRHGRIAHLRTPFTARVHPEQLTEVIRQLHPSPAVCGTPRDAAMRFIKDQEAHVRDLYAGWWGVWDPRGNTDLFVNIRCLHACAGKAAVYAGAGITAGSDPAQEWEETERKAATWVRFLHPTFRPQLPSTA